MHMDRFCDVELMVYIDPVVIRRSTEGIDL